MAGEGFPYETLLPRVSSWFTGLDTAEFLFCIYSSCLGWQGILSRARYWGFPALIVSLFCTLRWLPAG